LTMNEVLYFWLDISYLAGSVWDTCPLCKP
jgi:hypothetical protein